MPKSQPQLAFEAAVAKRLLDTEKKLNTQLNVQLTGIYNALKEIDAYVAKQKKTEKFDEAAFKKEMWTEMAKHWSKSISVSMSLMMAEDITFLLSDIKFGSADILI